MVGYIEEEDDIDTDMSDEDEDGDVNSSGTDLESSDRQYSRMAHQLSYLSGADGNSIEKRASSRASHKNPYFSRAFFGGEQSINSGRLASWPGDDVDSSRRKSLERGARSVGPKPVDSRGGGASGNGSGSDSVNERGKSFITHSSTSRHKRPSKAPGGKQQKAPGSATTVGPTVTLSAEAAAIVNASSPPPKAPSPSKAPERVDRRAAVGAEFGVGPRAEEFALPFVPASPPSDASGPGRRRGDFSLVRSMSFSKPVELGHPVERITTVSSTTKVPCATDFPSILPYWMWGGWINCAWPVSGAENTLRHSKEVFFTAVLIGNVNFLNFLFFFPKISMKKVCIIIERGVVCFFSRFLKPSLKARPPPPTPAVTRVITQQA